MKNKEIKTVEKIIENSLNEGASFKYNYCVIKEGFIEQEDIKKLLELGCEVENNIDGLVSPFRMFFKKDCILVETTIYSPTDIFLPSGEFKKESYEIFSNIIYADAWYITIK